MVNYCSSCTHLAGFTDGEVRRGKQWITNDLKQQSTSRYLLEWHQLSYTKTQGLYVMIEVTPLLGCYWMNGRTQTDANSMSFDQKIIHIQEIVYYIEIMHLISSTSTCKLYSITWLYNVAYLYHTLSYLCVTSVTEKTSQSDHNVFFEAWAAAYNFMDATYLMFERTQLELSGFVVWESCVCSLFGGYTIAVVFLRSSILNRTQMIEDSRRSLNL